MSIYRFIVNFFLISALIVADSPRDVRWAEKEVIETRPDLTLEAGINWIGDENEYFLDPLDDITRVVEGFGWYTATSGVLHGQQHLGVDFYSERGTNIYAPLNGYIIKLDNTHNNRGGLDNKDGNYISGGGNQIFIISEYKGKIYGFIFMHMKDITVKINTIVRQGDVIGYVGNSGSSLESHLHLEAYYLGDGDLYDYYNIDYPSDFWTGRSYDSRCSKKKNAPCILDVRELISS